jgi:hypothetical protein
MVFFITQNTHVKYQNTFIGKALFLSFLKLKALFDYIWKLKTLEYHCGIKQKKKHLSAYVKMKN